MSDFFTTLLENATKKRMASFVYHNESMGKGRPLIMLCVTFFVRVRRGHRVRIGSKKSLEKYAYPFKAVKFDLVKRGLGLEKTRVELGKKLCPVGRIAKSVVFWDPTLGKSDLWKLWKAFPSFPSFPRCCPGAVCLPFFTRSQVIVLLQHQSSTYPTPATPTPHRQTGFRFPSAQ